MAFSLSRNCTLIVSTVGSSWVGAASGTIGGRLRNSAGTAGIDTYEIPVLDGFSFSQGNQTQNITVNEAGDAPKRGQQIFNTALDPVDFSFTTYVRPYQDTDGGGASSAVHSATEKLLWNAMVASTTDAESGAKGVTSSATNLVVDFNDSDVHQLELLNYYFYFSDSGLCYKIGNGVLNSAEVDFSIDGLAQISWDGQGESLVEVGSTRPATAGTDYLAAPATADFITNKLSTCTLGLDLDGSAAGTISSVAVTAGGTGYTSTPTVSFTGGSGSGAKATATVAGGVVTAITVTSGGFGYTSAPTINISGGAGSGATATATAANGSKEYSLAVTGGSLTFDNGITWLTPEELGVINQPQSHFTGTRAVSGSLTCYLTSGGASDSEELLNDFMSDVSSANPDTTVDGTMTLNIGGAVAPNMSVSVPHAHFTIPTIDVADVVSVTIEFTGLESTAFSSADEATITYKGSTSVDLDA